MANTAPNYQVANLSVVLAAQSHNPSIINPDFLKHNKIVEEDWDTISPPVTTPVVAQINYEKISWTITNEQCVVSEQIKGEFRDSYYLHTCAKKYAEVLKHISYRALGLNWQIIIQMEENTADWIKSKFLKSGEWQKGILSTDLTLKFRADDDSVFYLAVGSVNDVVAVHCNFHFDIADDEKKIEMIGVILSKWKNYQNIFIDYIDKYFMNEGVI